MERTLITWNFVNWITVLLMVGLGYMVVALAFRLVSGRMGSGNTAANSNVPGLASTFKQFGIAA